MQRPRFPRDARMPRGASAVALLLTTALLSACRVPEPSRPLSSVRPPEAFSSSGGETAPARWWQTFEDPALDAHVEQALEGNLDLEALWQRIAEARAVARREAAPLFPLVDGFVEGEVTSRDFEESRFGLGALAAYEVDLWGRIRAGVQAEKLRAQAAAADYRAGALLLAAEVSTTYYQMLEAALQVALLDEQIASNEQIRQLIQARVTTQQLSGADLLRQEELIESTREQRILARAARRLLENQMAVLLGQAPGATWAPPAANAETLPDLPPPPDTGVPIELVRRRPDIQRTQYLVCAADRDLAAAIRDCYPRLELGASLSTEQSDSSDIFRDWLGSFAAGLLAPLFDGGRRAAEARRTRAVRDGVLLVYGQTVLVAFREVEDALTQEAARRDRVASLQRQLELTEETTTRLRTSYFNGVGNYIDVLAALTAKQQVERDLLAARRELVEARIALYRALAGSIPTPREGRE